MIMEELVFKGENGSPMTTSLIVAEIFGKEHNKVCRDIESLSCSTYFQHANFGVLLKNRDLPNGGYKEEKFYLMTKDGFTFLVMGYTGEKAGEFKEKFIFRFNEMEKQIQSGGFKVPSTFSEALMLAARQAEQIEEQQKVISIMAPKAEYFDCLVDRQLNVNFRDTAKELGVKQTEFIKWMLEKRYIYRDAKKQIKPYAQCVDAGLFVVKEYGNERHAGVQTLITPKGRETFRMLYAN